MCAPLQALLLVLPMLGTASAMGGYHPAPVYKEEPAPYQFEYGVHDDYHGTNFNAGEVSDAYGNVEVSEEEMTVMMW